MNSNLIVNSVLQETLLDTLADGRQLRRLYSPALASKIQPGLSLQDNELTLPVFRHDSKASHLDIIASPSYITSNTIQISGSAFQAPERATHCLFITEGDGVFKAIHALFCWRTSLHLRATVLSAFDGAMPFRPCPSRLLTPALPAHVIAAIPLLEDWGVLSRIAHHDAPGCWDGELQKLTLQLRADADHIFYDPHASTHT